MTVSAKPTAAALLSATPSFASESPLSGRRHSASLGSWPNRLAVTVPDGVKWNMYRSGLATDGAVIPHNESMVSEWLAACALAQVEWTSQAPSAMAHPGSAGAALSHRFSAKPAVAGAGGARIRGMD